MKTWIRWGALLALFVAPLALGQEPPVEPEDVEVIAEPGTAMGTLVLGIGWLLLGLVVSGVGAVQTVTRDKAEPPSLLPRLLPTFALLWGLAYVFVGERLHDETSLRTLETGLGTLAVALSAGLRFFASARSTDLGTKAAQRNAGLATLVVLAGLGVYSLSTAGTAEMLGFTDTALDRFTGVFTALSPIVLLSGLLPVVFLERAMVPNPIVLPVGAARSAFLSGLASAFAVALLFPVNYVAGADKYVWESDYSYFRVTGVGSATRGVVRTLSEPVTAYLYFSPGSEVREKAQTYFDELARGSEGLLSVEVVDSALRPDLAEEHGIRENGYVVLAMGDRNQKFKLGTDIDRARRELTKLDATVQKNLLKLASDEQIVYFLTGHGEGSWRERDNPLRKMSDFKRTLEDLNFKTEVLGLTEGSAVAIPDDAALLVVASPLLPPFPEEMASIEAYLDRGGALLLLLDPGAAPMGELLGKLGISAGQAPIANERAYISQSRGIADRVLVATNRFGSHEAVRTISRNSTQLGLVLPTALALSKLDGTDNDVKTLVRSYPDSWEDTIGNREQDDTEPGQVFELAFAVEPEGGDGFRAIVIGDVSVFSDPAYEFSRGNRLFAEDAAKWLVGEEDLLGETEREEDVEIRHTRDGEQAWFWGTILGVPLFILVIGGVFVTMRRKS